jgi:serine/threonine protein phosphatase PrpC
VEPTIKKTELRMINKYLIVASDGVWDVIQDEVYLIN